MPKVRDAIRLVESDGWYWVRTRGSHRQYRHRVKPGRVTIAGSRSDWVPLGTWKSILRQAGIEPRDT